MFSVLLKYYSNFILVFDEEVRNLFKLSWLQFLHIGTEFILKTWHKQTKIGRFKS